MNMGNAVMDSGTIKSVLQVNAAAVGKDSLASGERGPGALNGIFKKFGQSLPVVERVHGTLEVTDFSDAVVNGNLTTGDDRIRVRFEPRVKGPFPVLLRYLKAHACTAELRPPAPLLRRCFDAVVHRHDNKSLSPEAQIHIWVSGRAWVEGDGVIVILVRSFGMKLPEVVS